MKQQKKNKTDDLSVNEPYIRKRYSKANELVGYQVQINYYDAAGKRRTDTMTFTVKEYGSLRKALNAAIFYRSERLAFYRENNFGRIAKKSSLNELFEEVVKHSDWRIATIRKHTIAYKKYIKPYYGTTDIRDIGHNDVLSTLIECSKQCADQQIRNLKSVWKWLFIEAHHQKIAVFNLTEEIRRPRSQKYVVPEKRKPQDISGEDFAEFIKCMSTYGGYRPDETEKIYNRQMKMNLIIFSKITGLRPSECKAVRKSRIKFEPSGDDGNGNLCIVQILSAYGSGYKKGEENVERSLKTEESERIAIIHQIYEPIVRKMMEQSKYDLLFANYKGEVFTVKDLSDFCSNVSKKCGIKVYPYLMRKVFSSEMDDFMPLHYVSRLDGHKDINTTNRHYIAKKGKKLKKYVSSAEINTAENERYVSPDALLKAMNRSEDDDDEEEEE